MSSWDMYIIFNAHFVVIYIYINLKYYSYFLCYDFSFTFVVEFIIF